MERSTCISPRSCPASGLDVTSTQRGGGYACNLPTRTRHLSWACAPAARNSCSGNIPSAGSSQTLITFGERLASKIGQINV
jgi:hypothetical protein